MILDTINSYLNNLLKNKIAGLIIYGDSLQILPILPKKLINLVYIDPPFGTGKIRKLSRIKTKKINNEENKINENEKIRGGFGDKKYSYTVVSTYEYSDEISGELFFKMMEKVISYIYDVLLDNGSFYLHLNWQSVFEVKLIADKIFGKNNFLNDIIWAYDFGGKPKKYWPRKHDHILFYVKNNKNYVFNTETIDRIPYMAPSLVNEEKRKKGKLPTDVWWMTIVPTNSKERTHYPTQKPEKLLRRIIVTSSNENDIVADFFAGSGTTGIVALQEKRRFILIDNNPTAIEVMKKRFSEAINQKLVEIIQ